jgi:hypothetical protein
MDCATLKRGPSGQCGAVDQRLHVTLGMVALRPGLTSALRAVAFGAALCCFAQIVATAVTKSAAGLLALV